MRMGRRPTPELLKAEEEMRQHGVPEQALEPYINQVHACKRRGIAMQLSLKQWWDWWQEDNRWARRGKRRGQIMMLRKGDKGDYALDNIYAGTSRDNSIDAHRNERFPAEPTARMLFSRITNGRRLSNREKHPCARPVFGPLGYFASAALAAEQVGVDPATMATWCRIGEWYFLHPERAHLDNGSSHGWRYLPKLRKRPITAKPKVADDPFLKDFRRRLAEQIDKMED